LAIRENLLNDLIGKILELFEIAYLGKEETEEPIKGSTHEPSDIKVKKEYFH